MVTSAIRSCLGSPKCSVPGLPVNSRPVTLTRLMPITTTMVPMTSGGKYFRMRTKRVTARM